MYFIIGCCILNRICGFTCPVGNNGLHSNINDHHSFWQCSNGIAYLFHCPNMLVWSQEKQICDWKAPPPTVENNDDGICSNATWNPIGITKAGSNKRGTGLNELDFPSSFVFGADSSMYIADTFNHRIVKWLLNGSNSQSIIAGAKGIGNQTDQLRYVHRVILDEENTMYICDSGNSRVLRWFKNENYGHPILENFRCWGMLLDNDGSLYVVNSSDNSLVLKWPEGKIVAGGNGRGNAFNQLRYPDNILIDRENSIYIADVDNHRIVKWVAGAKEGVVIAGGNGVGKCLHQLQQPMGVALDSMENLYVADHGNHRIVRWLKGSKSGDVLIGKSGPGDAPDQLRMPTDLKFDRNGHLWVSDYSNHRIQMFTIDKSACSSTTY
ncbi:unnamed protein product [Rotaria socialis]|nr:unnamed protein product [Rotaria socialis]